jgi:hypothetical protein
MRTIAYPRTPIPPSHRSGDPSGEDFAPLRHYQVGRTAVLEPLAPEPTADFVETLRSRRARPIPTPIPVPRPVPMPTGSRFFIWEQDPSVGELGRRLLFVPGLMVNGPRDARIDTTLPGTTPVSRNANGDFLFSADTPEGDCAHAFAIVRMTLAMYERARDGMGIPWAWNLNGNTDVVTAHPRAGVTPNAFYSRGQKALKFFYFTPAGATEPLFTCRSLDIVAHETGHAVLDGLRPGWIGINNPPQTGGLHESFGDLSAIFLALAQLDLADALIAMTKADLHQKNFLAALAEQFGAALGRPTGLRNADNDLKLSQVSNEVHEISQVFTGAIYDILADIFRFERIRQSKTKDPAWVLVEVSQHLSRLLLNALLRAPDSGATYIDVVNQLLRMSKEQNDPRIYRTFIYDRFALREVVATEASLAIARGTVDWQDPAFADRKEDNADLAAPDSEHPSLTGVQDRTGCCGTMQLPEYARDRKVLEAELSKLVAEGAVIPETAALAENVAELKRAFK